MPFHRGEHSLYQKYPSYDRLFARIFEQDRMSQMHALKQLFQTDSVHSCDVP